MSTRATRRHAIATAISTAFGNVPVYADPFAALLELAEATSLTFALARGVRTADVSAEMGEIHQPVVELWQVYFLIPGHAPAATEDLADEVFEKLQAALAPESGFKPADDAGPLELREEDLWSREGKAGVVFYATFAGDFWGG